MSVRLTDDEAWDALTSAHTGILTTLKADGAPITLPLWFVVLDRTICLAAPSGTKKIARVRRDPRASFLIESGRRWVELRAVHLSGRIEEVTDDPTIQRIDAALDAKYGAFRSDRSTLPQAAQDHYAERTFLRLVPEGRLLTWDNARMRTRADG